MCLVNLSERACSTPKCSMQINNATSTILRDTTFVRAQRAAIWKIKRLRHKRLPRHRPSAFLSFLAAASFEIYNPLLLADCGWDVRVFIFEGWVLLRFMCDTVFGARESAKRQCACFRLCRLWLLCGTRIAWMTFRHSRCSSSSLRSRISSGWLFGT